MFDIITFGSATQDIFVKPRYVTMLRYGKAFGSTGSGESSGKEVCFPVGGKIDIDQMDFYSGGGGTNSAATFALQGFKTAFCGTIGSDVSGQEIFSELKGLNINTSFVGKTDKKMTNHSIVILNNNEDRSILTYRGAAELMEKKDIPWAKLKAKWMYLAPLTGLLCDNFEDLVNFAFDKKIKIAVNPSIAQLTLKNFSEIAKKIDVLNLNQEEASFLTKLPAHKEAEIFSALKNMCPGVVIMTKGSDGVLVSSGKDIYSAVPPENRVVVDTTGAGDSFSSGFLSEFIRSSDIEKAMQLAMGNAVGCLSKIGAKNGLLKKGQEFQKVDVKKEQII